MGESVEGQCHCFVHVAAGLLFSWTISNTKLMFCCQCHLNWWRKLSRFKTIDKIYFLIKSIKSKEINPTKRKVCVSLLLKLSTVETQTQEEFTQSRLASTQGKKSASTKCQTEIRGRSVKNNLILWDICLMYLWAVLKDRHQRQLADRLCTHGLLLRWRLL